MDIKQNCIVYMFQKLSKDSKHGIHVVHKIPNPTTP